jgi:hypothetical protein
MTFWPCKWQNLSEAGEKKKKKEPFGVTEQRVTNGVIREKY